MHACSSKVGQPLVDAPPLVDVLLQNSKCCSLAGPGVIVDFCSTNANNEYCAVVIGSDMSLSESDVTSNVDSLLESLILTD